MRRFQPVMTREPRTMRSHRPSWAVCRMVSGTLPHLATALWDTSAASALAEAWAISSWPCRSMLSISSSEDDITSGMV